MNGEDSESEKGEDDKDDDEDDDADGEEDPTVDDDNVAENAEDIEDSEEWRNHKVALNNRKPGLENLLEGGGASADLRHEFAQPATANEIFRACSWYIIVHA